MEGNLPVPNIKLDYRPTAALKNCPRNCRIHTKRQIKQIAESIKVFGFINPILIDGNDTVVAGHGRLAAAMQLGMDKIPTIRLENLSPDQLRAYMVADNRLAENGGWNEAALAIELKELGQVENLDVTVTGFDLAEIDLAIHPVRKKRHRELNCSVPSVAVAKPGDIWILGEHRFICGTSADPDSYKAVDKTIRGWQEHTGGQAIHAVTARSFDNTSSSSEAAHESNQCL